MAYSAGPTGSGWVEINAVTGMKTNHLQGGTKNCDPVKEAFLAM